MFNDIFKNLDKIINPKTPQNPYNHKVGNPIIQSFIDNVIRETVKPVKGSIIYCDLAFSTVEHSGVFVGNNKIVHLDGSGKIEMVSPTTFLERLDGFNTAISIYVSCKGLNPVGSDKIAQRAKSMVGKRRNYNLIMDNCHQFTSGCITGNFENSDNFFWMLEKTTQNYLEFDTWRVWNRN